LAHCPRDPPRWTPSPPSDGGEGRGEVAPLRDGLPLSPTLSPLVPRRARESPGAVARCARGMPPAFPPPLRLTPAEDGSPTVEPKRRRAGAVQNTAANAGTMPFTRTKSVRGGSGSGFGPLLRAISHLMAPKPPPGHCLRRPRPFPRPKDFCRNLVTPGHRRFSS
jgi:hypothetical protein